MADIGYYRAKQIKTTTGRYIVYFLQGGNLISKTDVNVKDFCEGQRLLKYLDKNGQYRLLSGVRFWEGKAKPTMIGKTNKFISSILSSQSSTSNIGYKNERTITITSEDISIDELEFVSQIYDSPRVYLWIGTDSFEEKDWLEVTIKCTENIFHERKKNFTKLTIDITLPETYSITMQ